MSVPIALTYFLIYKGKRRCNRILGNLWCWFSGRPTYSCSDTTWRCCWCHRCVADVFLPPAGIYTCWLLCEQRVCGSGVSREPSTGTRFWPGFLLASNVVIFRYIVFVSSCVCVGEADTVLLLITKFASSLLETGAIESRLQHNVDKCLNSQLIVFFFARLT